MKNKKKKSKNNHFTGEGWGVEALYVVLFPMVPICCEDCFTCEDEELVLLGINTGFKFVFICWPLLYGYKNKQAIIYFYIMVDDHSKHVFLLYITYRSNSERRYRRLKYFWTTLTSRCSSMNEHWWIELGWILIQTIRLKTISKLIKLRASGIT